MHPSKYSTLISIVMVSYDVDSQNKIISSFPKLSHIRSIATVDKFCKTLMDHHDEIADLKSYFDGRGNSSFDDANLPFINIYRGPLVIVICH